jgi:hypothetical protein
MMMIIIIRSGIIMRKKHISVLWRINEGIRRKKVVARKIYWIEQVKKIFN